MDMLGNSGHAAGKALQKGGGGVARPAAISSSPGEATSGAPSASQYLPSGPGYWKGIGIAQRFPCCRASMLLCARCGTLLQVDVVKQAAACALCGSSKSFAGIRWGPAVVPLKLITPAWGDAAGNVTD